ncbi:MAG: sulfite exporter TauE/SafE family protein, partial [Planctomycetota bacterium]
GLVGVGGGILKVPMMVLLFGVPMEIAVGSSAFMVGMTAAGGFAGHVASGHWDWRTSLAFGVAVFVGGQLGARKSISIDKKKMKRIFGWFLLVMAALMVGKTIA